MPEIIVQTFEHGIHHATYLVRLDESEKVQWKTMTSTERRTCLAPADRYYLLTLVGHGTLEVSNVRWTSLFHWYSTKRNITPLWDALVDGRVTLEELRRWKSDNA